MGLGDYESGRDPHDEAGTSPGGFGGGSTTDHDRTAPAYTQAERVRNVGSLNIDVEKYKDFIKGYDKTYGQKERVQAVGTTETPYQGPEAPFDLKSPMGLAKFFGSFTGMESGLETVGSAFKFNYDRQQALLKKIMADHGVDEAGAKSIIDKSGLNITDIYKGSSSPGTPDGTGDSTGASATGGLLTMGTGTTTGDFADPFSMFGSPEGGYPTTPEGSAAASIKQQELQRKIVETLYDPYYKSATEGALPQLMAMATGEGEVDYTPSKLYEYSKEKGERNIRRTQAAKGLLGSSSTADIKAEFGEQTLLLQLRNHLVVMLEQYIHLLAVKKLRNNCLSENQEPQLIRDYQTHCQVWQNTWHRGKYGFFKFNSIRCVNCCKSCRFSGINSIQ